MTAIPFASPSPTVPTSEPGPELSGAQSATVPPEAPDWRPFAEALLAAVKGTSWAGWRVSRPPKPTADPAEDNATSSAGPAARKTGPDNGHRPEADASPDTGEDPDNFADDSVDDLLDRLESEAEAAGMGVLLPPLPPAAEGPPTIWRPKAVTLLAAIRIAATFRSPEALATALGTPGAITLLATGGTALGLTVRKLLEQALAEPDLWPSDRRSPELLSATDAVKSGGADLHRPLGAFSDKMRDAVERGRAIVLLTSVAGLAPRDLQALQPQEVTLASLDRTALAVLLDLAYPGQEAATALTALPLDARVSRLTPDALTLSLRASDPEAAVRAIVTALSPAPNSGLGWAEFPLPNSVRAPLAGMIRDLHDWQDGRIAWRDVARGPLLVGPPGTGKTQIAKLLAEEAGVAVVAGSVAKWSGEGARSSEMVRAMRSDFAQAAELAPSILFVDEVDSFGDRARRADHNSAYTDFVVGAFLDLLDGYEGHEGVVVMAATNHPDKLDRAIVRPGRFDRILTLPQPDIGLLPKAFRWHLGSDLPEADLSGIGHAALGMSGADIAACVRAARGHARQARRDLTLNDLAAAIATTHPPLPEALRRIVSVHESGHAIVAAAMGQGRVSTVAIGSEGGFTATSLVRTGEDRATIEAHLSISMAGRAAERLVLGQASAGSGGDPGSDLASATRLATALEASWGLGSSLIWQGPADSVEARLRDDIGLRARVETHLRNAEARAARILTAHRALLEEMASALDTAGVLSGEALAAFLARV
uniref:AAA family ATPase n=1 Tax=Nioella ostreopsis TaxID=2448479 RepID=UPI000FD871BC